MNDLERIHRVGMRGYSVITPPDTAAVIEKNIERTGGHWFWRGVERPQVGLERVHYRRLIWEWHRGYLGARAQVESKCGVADCVNPAHLREISNRQK